MQIPWDLDRIAFGEETRRFIGSLTEEERREINAWVNAHETEIEEDCSDGPNLAVEFEAAAMKRRMHTCCGWLEGKKTVRGRTLIVGSCHGH